MKKTICIFLALCTVLLCACGGYPKRAADGSEWSEDWVILGTVLGVEEPGSGLSLRENNAVLTGDDLYYASWTAGGSVSYINEDGKEVELYDAQLYLLLFGCADGDFAWQAVDEWIARENETYNVTGTREVSCNGQDFTLLLYECGSNTNPYSRGAAAFTVYGSYAVSAELACRDVYSGDEEAVLLSFLEGCHYAEID